MTKPADTYKEEAYERLTELEGALLELEEAPDDSELISKIFRALHTIKGSGAMFGFDDIASFTHEVETVFDLVRNGRIPVGKELIDLTLQAGDLIRSMLDGTDPMVDGEGLLPIRSSGFCPAKSRPTNLLQRPRPTTRPRERSRHTAYVFVRLLTFSQRERTRCCSSTN